MSNDYKLQLVEKFVSIQGESSYIGQPCIFIRTYGCNLRCKDCDTKYAYDQEKEPLFEPIQNIVDFCYNYKEIPLVELTGGEVLIQRDAALELCYQLIDFKTILIETNGSISLAPFCRAPKNLVIIMDVKTPSTGMVDQLHVRNFSYLRPWDELKFVVADQYDLDYSKNIIRNYGLEEKCKILFSPMYNTIPLQELAHWIKVHMPTSRMQVQLHKIIWPPETRGV